MKKFLAILALLAVALNFSSARLWAEEITVDGVTAVVAEDKKEGSDAEAALGNAVVTGEAAKTEEVAAVVKPAVLAVTEEEKQVEEMGSVLPDTTQDQDKIS